MSLAEHPAEQSVPDRAQARIRWQRPAGVTVVLTATWLVGLLFALVVPAFIVNPGQETAPHSHIIWAAIVTVLGTVVMLVSAWVLYKRTAEVGYAVLGGVPAMACMVGGIVLAAAKLTGQVGGVH